MPTAGRLAGALVFFIYGWYIAIIALPLFPNDNPPSFLFPLSIGIAVICGWRVVGSRLGQGYRAAIGYGLTGAFVFSLWMLFLIAGSDMIARSMRRVYDGAIEAVVDVFNLMMRLAVTLFDINLLASIVIGGIICGLIAEYFARRFP